MLTNSFTMKRSRNRIASLGIVAVLGSSLIQSSVGEDATNDDADDSAVVGYLGIQYISQECAPRRRRKRNVQVTEVDLICDSQGNDDGGGGGYTDKPLCKPGDLAKAAVSFTLRDWSESSGDIYIDLESSAYGKFQRIYQHTDICYLQSIAYWGEDEAAGDDLYAQAKITACPLGNGPYTFFIGFTVPSYTNDANLQFTPDLRVEFYDEDRTQVGCVETGTLAEWSASKGMERRGQRFFVVSILACFLVSAFCLMRHKRRRRQGDQARRNKQASMMRRFHYIQTSRSGDIHRDPSMSTTYTRSSYSVGSSSSAPRSPTVPTIPDVA